MSFEQHACQPAVHVKVQYIASTVGNTQNASSGTHTFASLLNLLFNSLAIMALFCNLHIIIRNCTVLIYAPLLLLLQFEAKNLLQGSVCIHQHLCYRPIAHHNHPASCSIQHSVGVCGSGISDVHHVGSGVPLSVEVSEL